MGFFIEVQKLMDHQRKIVFENPNAKKITGKHVVYTPEFKIRAVKSYFEGLSPVHLFSEAGIDLSYFIPKYYLFYVKR